MANKVSKNRQNAYAAYKAVSRWKTNREVRLLRALKANPNNTQIGAAIKNISYRRRTPKASFWSHSMKRSAQLIKEFCGSCPHAVFNSNKLIATEALANLGRGVLPKGEKHNKPVDFSLKGRMRFKQ